MRFIICSSRRCGAHMLATALDQHPQLKVAGEVLVRPERYGVFADLDAEGQPCHTMEDTWSKYNGFINQRDHTNPWVWNYVAGLADVIFISLKRRNLLKAYLSEKVGYITEAWQLQQEASALLDADKDDWVAGDYKPEVKVALVVGEVHEYIEKTHKLFYEIDQKMMHFRHPFLELYYEDLLQDWEHWLAITQLILGVQPQSLRPATRKQETRRMPQIIENYQEFCNGAVEQEKWWAHMVEDIAWPSRKW